MILHSIISPSDIFYNETDYACPARYTRIDGGMLELDGDTGAVRRLISTDPRLFLDSRYTPSETYDHRHNNRRHDKNGRHIKYDNTGHYTGTD